MTEHPHVKLLAATEAHANMHRAVSSAAAQLRDQADQERAERAAQAQENGHDAPGR